MILAIAALTGNPTVVSRKAGVWLLWLKLVAFVHRLAPDVREL